MAEKEDTQPNWPLILPIGLLIIEIIVFVIMRLTRFHYLRIFILFLDPVGILFTVPNWKTVINSSAGAQYDEKTF